MNASEHGAANARLALAQAAERSAAKLRANVRPAAWSNPAPSGRYNLVVIGGGTAGLIGASIVATLGGKVALIEREALGGDCLNTGCVPSKAIIRSSRICAELRDAYMLGVESGSAHADFAAVMERMRRIQARISQKDSASRMQALGVEVYFGGAHFTGKDTLDVDGRCLRFRRALIAAGSHPVIPGIEGLVAAGYLNNETVFDLAQLPRRLLVVGGGPLGCELAQAFHRLGSHVTIVQREPQFLPQEERDAAQILSEALARDGLAIHLNTEVVKVTRSGDERTAHMVCAGKESTVTVDEVVAGAGRAPNVDGLELKAANVDYDGERGVTVDDFLRTSNPRIYAAGDIIEDSRYTHMAEATARIAVQNALFFGRKRLSALTVPWCTYTDPEIAHVGMYTREARKRGIPVKTFTIPMNDVDRAIADGEEEGFVKVTIKDGTDRILGATIVARHAGEMINEITLAMVAGVGFKTLSNVIHTYPTQAEAIRRAADAYRRTQLTPLLKRLTTRWLAWNK